jgi:predicted nucleotidyltransferase
VILPMTVLRRLDAVLEPTKQAVLEMKASLDSARITNQDPALRQAAGQAFYNTSRFTLRDPRARASQQQLKADFETSRWPSLPNSGRILPNMGTRASGLAEVLFTPVQQRLLGLLFGQPDRRFQSAELIRLAGSGTGATHRLLTRLADTGLVNVTRVGNQKHYQANRDSPIFSELHGLVVKTSGLAGPLRAALSPLAKRIHAAFVYGSVAKGTDRAGSDIDLMIIAEDLDYADVFSALQAVEGTLARTVNPNVMSLAEWRRKRKQAGFVSRIAGQPRLFLIGSDDELR